MYKVPSTNVTKKDTYNAFINLVEMCYAWCLAKWKPNINECIQFVSMLTHEYWLSTYFHTVVWNLETYYKQVHKHCKYLIM